MIATFTRQPAYLRYDAHETLDIFRERQSGAYQQGTIAWRDGRINGQALQLYNELIRYVGANKFAWIREDTLAEGLGRSVSTIKRWMRQLVSAELIQRGRRFGSASLTYIAAYGQDADLENEPEAATDDGTTAFSVFEQPQADAADISHQVMHAPAVSSEPTPPSHGYTASDGGAFFSATHEPSIGSFPRSHTIKNQHVKFPGGRIQVGQTKLASIEETEATTRLRGEGIEDPAVLHELHARSLHDIDRVIRYVARCRSTDDPRRPGLIVHLLRTGFANHGSSAHDGSAHRVRSDHNRSGRRTPVTTSDDARCYLSQGFCQHGMLGMCAQCETSTSTSTLVVDLCDTNTSRTNTDLMSTGTEIMWPAVLAYLAQEIAPDEIKIWFSQTTLLDIIDDCVIIGTPNVFVRNHVRDAYASYLLKALSSELGHPVQVEVVIDTPAHT